MDSLRVRIIFEEEGSPREYLEKISERSKNAKPVLKIIQALMVRDTQDAFRSEGGSLDREWKQDSPEWAARKSSEGHGDKTEVLHGTLRDALMAHSSGGNTIRRLSRRSTTVGVRLYYAIFQMKKRPLMGITDENQNEYGSKMLEWLIDGRADE